MFMSSYLWRKLSEKEKENIKEQARDLILDFGDTIEQLPDIEEKVVERDSGVREEFNGEDDTNLDKQMVLDNSPKNDGVCIVAETGGWLK